MIRIAVFIASVVTIIAGKPRLETSKDGIHLVVNNGSDVTVVLEGVSDEKISIKQLYRTAQSLQANIAAMNRTLLQQQRIVETMNASLNQQSTKQQSFDAVIDQFSSNLTAKIQQVEALNASLSQQSAKQQSFDAVIDRFNSSLTAKIQQVEAMNTSLSQQQESLYTLVDQLNSSLTAKIQQVEALNTSLSQQSAKQQSFDAVIDRFNSSLTAKIQQVETMSTSLSQQTAKQESLYALVDQLNSSLAAGFQQVEAINTGLNQQSAKQESFDALIDQLNSSLTAEIQQAGMQDSTVMAASFVNETVNAVCEQTVDAGRVRFNAVSRDVEYCDGQRWELLSFPHVGHPNRPASSCNDVAIQGLEENVNGIFSLINTGPEPLPYVNVYCEGNTSLGGNGDSPTQAGLSCQSLSDHFQIASGLYHLIASTDASNTEDLATIGTRRVYCLVDNVTGAVTTFEGGLQQAFSATNCSSLKAYFNYDLADDVYWVGGKQVLCDLEHPTGIELGGIGATAESSSTSCDAIRRFRISESLPLADAIYFVNGVETYCQLQQDSSISLGGDGTTQAKATASCSAAALHFGKQTGALWVGPVSDTSSARRVACIRGTERGGLGSSATDASPSCTHLHAIGLPTGTYWLDPDLSLTSLAPFQAYCYMGDGGGWTKILHIPQDDYVPSTAATGTPHLATVTVASKLSDAQVNGIRQSGGLGSTFVYRLVSPYTTLRAYIRTARSFSDRARSWGLVATSSQVCSAASQSKCSYRTMTGSYLDTLDNPGGIGNNCDRMFVDWGGAAKCYGHDRIDNGQSVRCVNSGQVCNQNGGNHPQVRNAQLFIRGFLE